MIKKIRRIIKRTAFSVLAFYTSFYAGSFALDYNYQKDLDYANPEIIRSEIQFRKYLDNEKKKLDCDKNIIAILVGEHDACSWRDGGNYFIKLGGKAANLRNLKHEVYHIYRGHTDTDFNILKYLLLWEPQAIIYHQTGLKF